MARRNGKHSEIFNALNQLGMFGRHGHLFAGMFGGGGGGGLGLFGGVDIGGDGFGKGAAEALKSAAETLKDAARLLAQAATKLGADEPAIGSDLSQFIFEKNLTTGKYESISREQYQNLPELEMLGKGGGKGLGVGGGVGMFGIAVAAIQMTQEAVKKLADGLFKLNEKAIELTGGFAKIIGVPDSIVQFGESVARLTSPLKLIGTSLTAFVSLNPFDAISQGLHNVGDIAENVGNVFKSLVQIFLDMRDPAHMIQGVLSGFTAQVGKYNPATIERFQLALDNLSAAAGYIFEPLVEAARDFADEVNGIFTDNGPALREAVSGLIPPMLNLARDVIVPLITNMQPFIQSLTFLANQMSSYGPLFGMIIGTVAQILPLAVHMFAGVFTVAASAVVSFSATLYGASQTITYAMEKWRTLIAMGPRAAAEQLHQVFAGASETFARAMTTNHAQLGGSGGMTFAAQQARQISIEQVGQEARAAAFSQGVNVQAQIRDNTNRIAENTQAMIQHLAQIAGQAANNVPEIAGAMQ